MADLCLTFYLQQKTGVSYWSKWTKAIQSYLLSKWSWASQWNISLHWCANRNSLSARHFTSLL